MSSQPVDVDTSLTVYIDFKSPYAYLAIEPTRRLGRELGVSINWLPFVLDIPSYLGAAKLGSSGKVVEQSRSEEQWSGVKYAYYDCRRYANLRHLTIRGTTKIWDTKLAAVGMLWAKQQGDDVLQAYIDAVFEPFWKRELDVEDMAIIEAVLSDCGAEVGGFGTFAEGAGAEENKQLQQDAFDRGIFGVPSYVLGDDLYFGREHIPRLRWQIEGQGSRKPDIACELEPDILVEAATTRTLKVGVSLSEADTELVVRSVAMMAKELNLIVRWCELPEAKIRDREASSDQSRGARHRRYRALNRKRDCERYVSAGCADTGAIELLNTQLLRREGIELLPDTSLAAGFSQSPVFLVGEERYIGRQHLPLIRARFESADEGR